MKTKDIYKPELLTEEEKDIFHAGLDHFLADKWSREEKRETKQQELKKLLAAGEITNEEYFKKVNRPN